HPSFYLPTTGRSNVLNRQPLAAALSPSRERRESPRQTRVPRRHPLLATRANTCFLAPLLRHLRHVQIEARVREERCQLKHPVAIARDFGMAEQSGFILDHLTPAVQAV